MQTPMAPPPPPLVNSTFSSPPTQSSPPISLHDHYLNRRLDLDAIHALISSVDRHVRLFLSNPDARAALQSRCTTRLAAAGKRRPGYFEFSDHSVISNLFWGVENVEAAVKTESPEERTARLVSSERMLQIPALLEEDGSTVGVANRYLVCCSYFYLSLVRGLRGDEWQMTMHLLQAVLVSPRYVRTEFAPELCGSLLGSQIPSAGCEDAAVDEATRQLARSYKDWLMYYRVVSYGETPTRWGVMLEEEEEEEESRGGEELRNCRYRKCASAKYSYSAEQNSTWPIFQDGKMPHPHYLLENKDGERFGGAKASADNVVKKQNPLKKLDEAFYHDNKESFDIKCLQEMLEDSQSDTSVSFYSQIDSTEGSDSEVRIHDKEIAVQIPAANVDSFASGRYPGESSGSSPEDTEISAPEAPRYPMHMEAYGLKTSYLLSSKSLGSVSDLSLSVLDIRDVDSYPSYKCYVEYGTPPGRSPTREFRCFGHLSSKLLRKYGLPELVPRGRFARKKLNFSNIGKDWSEERSTCENDNRIELLGRFEQAVSTLCFSEGLGRCKNAGLEVTTVWKMLTNKPETKYSTLKQEILHQLLDIISTSKEENIVRASVSILLVIISEDKSVLEDIKRKDLHLYGLARALKTNVQEAVILIYFLRPSPSEIKDLELLPALVEVACNPNSYRETPISLPLSPTAASIAMIENLVTAFDYVTNNMHLAAISSPQILSKLVNVARNKNLEEGVALAAILVRCMRLNGNCRKFLSQVTAVEPFLHLLRSNERRAKYGALEYFHEILRMPRSSAIVLLRQIRQQGSINIMHALMACIQQAQLEHKLLAANLLLQLDMLEDSCGKSVFKEEAMEVLLEAIAYEENSSTQILSGFILSNLGGTYAWTGEPYTAAWLVNKAGLTSTYHRNMIRNVDWRDPCLQEAEMDAWSIKIARSVMKIGSSVFNALAKGIQSKAKSVSRDCLIAVAWLGCEMAIMGPSNLRYSACEILLGGIVHFLHPGSELDERVLACQCVYNYASGKGIQKLMNFSEGMRESLRRLSGINWMAEELLRVTDYFLPTKPHVSCVHSQILETGNLGSGAATALIFYKGQLYAGYSDGSIKVWDIKGQSTKLIWDVKEHKKAVTCFNLFEQGDSLLSGSVDKTVRVWQMVQRKLECVEIINVKEPVQKLDTYGDRIFVITQSRGLKVCRGSRIIQTVCKNKHLRCLAVSQGRIYLGCTDSSIQEVDIINGQKQEIRPPANSWRMQNKPVNSILLYRGWVYCAGASVEESNFKVWRRRSNPQVTIAMGRGTSVQEMAVVEDFVYLSCSSSPSILEIWLRGKQQKVGRLSAGSKIVSLLTANDIVLCGTENGLIKGWIPL